MNWKLVPDWYKKRCGAALGHYEKMTSNNNHKQDRIAHYIDENLSKVFSELENDEMPDQILDLLSVLRAQDEERKAKKE